MVERVARAIYAQRNGTGCVPWSRRDNAHKAPYLDDALAALRAMRERTPAMIEAGPPEPYLHDEIWNHIIDAAINEGK